MTFIGKYDRQWIGALSGFVAPVIISLAVWFFSRDGGSLTGYFNRIVEADILTHIISLCVFPNIFLFLLFNRLDMLRATRGVLAITIFWAVLVFSVKFLL
jgi:hypothetical protein